MLKFAFTLLLCAASCLASANVLIVVGAPGEEEFGKMFDDWARQWKDACSKAGTKATLVGGTTNDFEIMRTNLAQEAANSTDDFWLVLIGHGTFDGKEAKFNLRGPDISSTEVSEWLKPFRRPVAIVDFASSSGAFLGKLSATNRVVITATRSGHEQNFARFGAFMSKAIGDPKADLDKDGQTSLLEAYLIASRELTEFYKTEGRLATEHPLLDDNGDGLGTPADWFRGIRATKRARDGAALDGFRAHQFHLVRSDSEQKMAPDLRAKRDSLELQIARLRENKSGLPEEEYYRMLEPLLLELARVYQP
ncbi:MAG TPA: hypothetical protein VJ063_14185 [Verrucomicrobiae bacterium]|nr:hypothetical protein [Verrucomicrobiae bacterium]